MKRVKLNQYSEFDIASPNWRKNVAIVQPIILATIHQKVKTGLGISFLSIPKPAFDRVIKAIIKDTEYGTRTNIHWVQTNITATNTIVIYGMDKLDTDADEQDMLHIKFKNDVDLGYAPLVLY